MDFIKAHTMDFEKELWLREKRTNWFPRPGFERTAACNVQKKRDFDQDAVIQQQWQNLVDYIVQVSKISFNQRLIILFRASILEPN